MKFKWYTTGHGATDNLGKQLEKITRNMNNHQISTRRTYIKTMSRFVKHIAISCNLQKLKNIQDKHLESYANYLKNEGRSDKYIKNELSGIRYYHNNIDDSKHDLSNSTKFNKMIGLGSTGNHTTIDRAWTEKEVTAMQVLAYENEKPEVAKIIEVMRSTGCRIEEAATLKDHQIRQALKSQELKLHNTKGGVPRSIPLTDRAREIFTRQLKETERGHYAFTPEVYVQSHSIHSFVKQVQNFIYNHRDKIKEETREESAHNVTVNSQGALTAHGLRHAFAREQYLQLKEVMPKEQARLEVAEMLGHHRKEITLVYLASIK